MQNNFDWVTEPCEPPMDPPLGRGESGVALVYKVLYL